MPSPGTRTQPGDPAAADPNAGNPPPGNNGQPPPSQPQGGGSGSHIEDPIEAQLKDLGVDRETFDKLVEKGIVIPAPQNFEQLPETVRKQIDEAIREAERNGAKLQSEQLHQTLTKYKGDLESLRKIVEERENRIRQDEEARERLEREKEEQNKTLTQRFEDFKRDAREAMENITNTSQQQLNQLQQQLNNEKLRTEREKLIASANGQIIPELVYDPETYPNLTIEKLQESVEVAKRKFVELRDKFVQEYRPPDQVAPSAQPGNPGGPGEPPPPYFPSQHSGGVVPPGNQHLQQQRQQIDPNEIRKAGRERLDQIKDDLMKKYGFTQ